MQTHTPTHLETGQACRLHSLGTQISVPEFGGDEQLASGSNPRGKAGQPLGNSAANHGLIAVNLSAVEVSVTAGQGTVHT